MCYAICICLFIFLLQEHYSILGYISGINQLLGSELLLIVSLVGFELSSSRDQEILWCGLSENSKVGLTRFKVEHGDIKSSCRSEHCNEE